MIITILDAQSYACQFIIINNICSEQFANTFPGIIGIAYTDDNTNTTKT